MAAKPKVTTTTVPASSYAMQNSAAGTTTIAGPTSTSLGAYTPAISAAGTGAATSTRVPTMTSEIQQPDITTTAYITNQVYQNLMGRDATADEIAQYHQQFTEYAKTHPIFTRQATYDPSTGLPYVAVRDITAQKNPLAEQDFITNIVRQGADSKAYQAATGYMGAMNQAMQQFGGGF